MAAVQRILVTAVCVWLISAVGASHSREPDDDTVKSVLKGVEDQLRGVLGDLDPAPQYHREGKSLRVEWRARKYLVHQRSKSGDFADEAREEIGPSYRGFMIGVQV